MTRERDALQQYGEETEAHGAEVEALRQRLLDEGWARDPSLAGPGGMLGAFRKISEPLDHRVGVVAARVRGTLGLVRGRTQWAFAAAALAGLVAAVGLTQLPAPELEAELVAEAEQAFVSPKGRVALAYAGEGELSGTEAAPRVEWRSGTVEVEVEPDRGTDFRLTTPEAEVRVIGTAFTVTRDALGTKTEVLHGRVAVSCSGQEHVELTIGQSRTCWPTTPAGLLGRGRRLLPDSPADAIAALSRGLDVADDGPVRVELAFARLEAHVAAGDEPAALADAQSLLERGAGHREPAVRELAETLTARLAQ